MVLLTHRASAKTWKRCKQSIKRMTRGKTETCIERLIWSQETICFGLVLVPMEFNQKKLSTNLKRLVLLGYLIRRTPCVQMCTNYIYIYMWCIGQFTQNLLHIPSHSYQVWNMTKLWLNTICQNSQISPQTEDNGFSDSQRSQKEQFYPACTTFPLRLIFLKLSPLPFSRTMS